LNCIESGSSVRPRISIPSMDPAVAIRQTSALVLVSTLVWDMFREKSRYDDTELATWTLAINFIYFQLPLKSRALAFFHPVAFISSMVTPAAYLFLLYCNPNYERLRMDDWGLSWAVMLARALFVYASPLLFHALDINTIAPKLIFAYQAKSKKFQV